jgi:hypothetical protein
MRITRQEHRMRFAALLLAALLAFCWHNVVIQTHVHLPTSGCGAISPITICPANSHSNRQNPKIPDRQDDCPLCHELAVSGHYLAPPPIIFIPPVLILVWAVVAGHQRGGLQRRSHRWQSRAPPHSLRS